MTAEVADKARDAAGDTTRHEPADAPVLSTPTPEDDERVRGLIRAELDRQHANPLARRTLELLAEAELEPVQEEPGYRVVDRSGETRLVRDGDADPEEGGNVAAPMTLRSLVTELRDRHPDLFAPPPEPAIVDPVPPPPSEPAHDALADAKAAGARFVETRSARARSFAASSAARGRSFAGAARGRLEAWRTRLGERFKAQPVPAPVASTAMTEAPADERPPAMSLSAAAPGAAALEAVHAETKAADGGPADLSATHDTAFAEGAAGVQGAGISKDAAGVAKAATTFRAHLGDLARRGRDALPVIDRHAVDLRRIAILGLVVVTGLVIAVAVITDRGGEDGASAPASETPRTEAAKEASREAPKETPTEASRTEARNDSAPAPKSIDPEAAPEDAEAAPVEEAPRNPNDVVGVPQVIDTATLKLSGKVIHLFGVEWVRGGQADELAKYIRGRTVTCRPASGSSAFLCSVGGRDLSEVVLFNGGGRASSEASPDLVAAEDHARGERLGVWKR